MVVSFSYKWLKSYVGEALPSVSELTKLITLHAFEVEGVEEKGEDTLIDLKIMPDRGSDCLSHRGVAREIATILNVKLADDPLTAKVNLPKVENIKISVEDLSDCPRFMLAHFKNVKIAPSPLWLKDRLATIGQRSINNVVDATNYVMYALGQPMHAYDGTTFLKEDGGVSFVVRKAKLGETVAILPEGGATESRLLKMTGTELLIVNGNADTPIGLAGVKGGEVAKLHEGTTDILIEAANFDPILTRKTANRLGIVTDASKRFENGISAGMPPFALTMIAHILEETAGAELVGVAEVYKGEMIRDAVGLRLSKVNSLLGLSLTKEEVISIFSRLGVEIVSETETGFLLNPPFPRTDLNIEEDFIEEIGRIYGLEHIRAITPVAEGYSEVNKKFYYSELIRETLLRLGFSEVITSSFRANDEIPLANSLASDKNHIRSKLSDVLALTLQTNIQNQEILGPGPVKIFEIGSVFKRVGDSIKEEPHLALGVRTRKSAVHKEDKKLIEEAIVALQTIGLKKMITDDNGVVEVSLEDFVMENPLPEVYLPTARGSEISYKVFSRYPAIARDVSMWVPKTVSPEDILDLIKSVTGPLLLRSDMFDQFSKDDKISYAFRLVFQAPDRTLTDLEIETHMKAVYTLLLENNWEVR